MRFLADESCDFSIVRALRAAGHDVVAVREVALGADDDVVLELAVREGRVLLTEDKDFGQLYYAQAQSLGGVILIRFPADARTTLPGAVVGVVSQQAERLVGSFVVVQPGRVRIGRRPGW